MARYIIMAAGQIMWEGRAASPQAAVVAHYADIGYPAERAPYSVAAGDPITWDGESIPDEMTVREMPDEVA